MANEILQEVIFHDEELTNYLFSNRITLICLRLKFSH